MTTFSYEYRVAGQKRRSRALSVLPLAETMNQLCRLLGVPVGVRDVSGGIVGLEGMAAMVSATLEPLVALAVAEAA